jgi:hypothetical protein
MRVRGTMMPIVSRGDQEELTMRGVSRFSGVVALAVVSSAAVFGQGAAAQPATGTVTGRVVWGACLRGVPLPMTPGADVQPQPATPDVQPQPATPDMQPQPGRPIPIPTPFGLPAGAVLVAAQNTPVSARTDETGRFTLSEVPAGQFLTVAAGPVAASNVAVAERPNVMVSAGQSVDIGTLALGGSSAIPIVCRGPLDVPNGAQPATPESPDEAPAPAAP